MKTTTIRNHCVGLWSDKKQHESKKPTKSGIVTRPEIDMKQKHIIFFLEGLEAFQQKFVLAKTSRYMVTYTEVLFRMRMLVINHVLLKSFLESQY